MGFKEFMSYCFVIAVYTACVSIAKYLGAQMRASVPWCINHKTVMFYRVNQATTNVWINSEKKKIWNRMVSILVPLSMHLAKSHC